MKRLLFLSAALVLTSAVLRAQKPHSPFTDVAKAPEMIQLFDYVHDVAFCDVVTLAGPPKHYQKRTPECPFTDSLRNNPLKFQAYVFIPRHCRQNRRYPLVVYPHGGLHSSFGMRYCHILKELLVQGYIVIAPEYRGSTGFGKAFYDTIDYGGLENEDVLASRDYMVDSYSIVDPERVGIIGWSHGGMIALNNIMRYPDKYACAYAGVPVSDVAYRLSYKPAYYKDFFSPEEHVGCLPEDNPAEYARRSPTHYAKYLSRPLRITTCMNDDDVSVTEVKRMIDSLAFYNRDFEYRIYPKMSGAHAFERMDILEGCEVRLETYTYLARYLRPPHPFKDMRALRKASYFYY